MADGAAPTSWLTMAATHAGAFAPEFGKLFFPPDSKVANMMEAFAVFAGAFLMRPLGGMLFGVLGDRFRCVHAGRLRRTRFSQPVPPMVAAYQPSKCCVCVPVYDGAVYV